MGRLRLLPEKLAQEIERPEPVRDLVLVLRAHFRVRQPAALARLEDGVPAELAVAARGDDVALRAPLEQDGLVPGSGRVCEGAQRCGLCRREADEQLVKAYS